MPSFTQGIAEILKSKGFVLTILYDRQALKLNYYGVSFEISMIEFYRYRSPSETLNLVREKYRAIGGSMKVQIVRVAVDTRKTEFACLQIEAYPGDIRWQCGQCLNWGAWVRPELGAICQKRCGAKVCYVERQNTFGQRLVDQYDKSGAARRYFVYMDDKGQVQIKPDSDDKPDPLDFKDIQQTMQEQIERARAAEKARQEIDRAAQERLRAIIDAQRQAEINAAKQEYFNLRADMLRDYQVQGTRSLPGIIGPISSSPPAVMIGVDPAEKKKRPKKEKKPKPAKAPQPGVRRFRGEFPE
jgi:hypothetical protein